MVMWPCGSHGLAALHKLRLESSTLNTEVQLWVLWVLWPSLHIDPSLSSRTSCLFLLETFGFHYGMWFNQYRGKNMHCTQMARWQCCCDSSVHIKLVQWCKWPGRSLPWYHFPTERLQSNFLHVDGESSGWLLETTTKNRWQNMIFPYYSYGIYCKHISCEMCLCHRRQIAYPHVEFWVY